MASVWGYTRGWFAPVKDVGIVDDDTVDFWATAPNPILPDSIANWVIMDRDRAEANATELPNIQNGNIATLNAKGTCAFVVSDRQPGLSTILRPFDGWWNADASALDQWVLTLSNSTQTR